MKIYSHPVRTPDGLWLMLRWAGSDKEIALAKSYGLIPEAAAEIMSIVCENDGMHGDIAFALMPVEGCLQ